MMMWKAGTPCLIWARVSFYCDYGNYDYYITAPLEIVIYGSGDLQNAAQVLTAEQIKRLAAAANSEKSITIIGADEIGNLLCALLPMEILPGILR